MGNCCATPSTTDEKKKGKNKPNLFSLDYGVSNPSANDGHKNTVLENPAGHEIERTYVLGKEMGREEFGITYMCTDKFTGEFFACKSISKKKPGTRVDTEDVRREVEIMKHMPPHPNIVSLKDTYEDGNAIHLVMELCEGGELFDRIVARGHYTERVAASVIQHFQQTTAGSSSFLLSVPSLHQPRSLVTSPATFMFFSLFLASLRGS